MPAHVSLPHSLSHKCVLHVYGGIVVSIVLQLDRAPVVLLHMVINPGGYEATIYIPPAVY